MVSNPKVSIAKLAGRLILFVLWGVCAAGQTLLNAPAAQNFGQVSANTAPPKTQTFSYTLSGSIFPTFSLHYALDYSISSQPCSGSGSISCSVTVAFAPRFPGLRQDAVIVKNSAGAVLAETLLAGTGMGPQASVFPGVISTVAGNGAWGYAGDGGLAAAALLRNPQGIAIDNSGNLFIADSLNQVVREVVATRMSTVAGTALGVGYAGDAGLATKAHLNTPCGIALDGAGNLFIADQGNNVIRRVDAVTQIITTVAGGGTVPSGTDGLGDGGPATRALLNGPSDVAVDAAGNLFISDSMHGLIRKVDATGVITVYAGGGTSSGADGLGDGGPAKQASLRYPLGIGLDAVGNLFIADSENGKVRRVDATSGNITALTASFTTPSAVRIDPAGNVYVADSAQNVVIQINAAGGIFPIAGTVAALYTGDGGPANLATLSSPSSLALDANGNIYISDFANNAIRKVTVQPPALLFPTTLVGQVSPSQALQIMNTGNQNLVFSGLTLSSSFPQLLNGFSDCSASSALAAGGFCGIGMQFVPLNTGLNSGSLLLKNNSLNFVTVQNFNLNGTGAAGAVAQLSMNTTNLAFGNQTIGTSSAAQTVTITNRGTAAMPAFNAYASGSNDFTYGGNCGSPLAIGASCQISIVFTPSVIGARSASLSLNTGLANMQQINLAGTGTGAPQAALSATVLNFGSRSIGVAGSAKTVTLSNTGSSSLTISSVAIAGANAADFSSTNTCGVSVGAGSSCVFTISFAPHTMGLRTATLTIAGNAATQTIVLKGVGSVRAAPAVWRPSTGTWFVSNSSASAASTGVQWGLKGDVPVPGDYDGDGKMDLAVFRPSNATWYIVPSSTSTFYSVQMGGLGDVPVPADYDGDGKTDLAVFRPSNGTWYISPSRTLTAYSVQWGLSGDIPVPGDYDGDGKADTAVFRPSNGTWYIVPSSTSLYYTRQWGLPGDVPVTGDYDGDGKLDIAVWRASNGSWLIVPSSTGIFYTVQWGVATDTPLPGDYDGDGRTDICALRPSSVTTWLIVPSATGRFYPVQYGLAGDDLVPGSYGGAGI